MLIPDQFVYIGRSQCGCVYIACLDHADQRTANAVAEVIAGGGSVERLTWAEYQEVMNEPTFMNCPHEQKTD